MRELKGKPIADKILADLKEKISKKKAAPGLAVVLVGEDEASEIYVNLKRKRAEEIGIKFYLKRFSDNSSQDEIISNIIDLNENEKINGIVVQLPLSEKFDTQKIINSIDPKKDVDGFHPENLEKFLKKEEKFWPVFPKAIIKMIENSAVDIVGKRAIILTNSKKFGEIMKEALKRKNIFGEYVLSDELESNFEKIKKADLVVSAIGRPGIIKGPYLKKGALVIDGGISKDEGKIVGDVDLAYLDDNEFSVSPVPGGVGPVTIANLLENVFIAFLDKSNK